MTKTGVALSLWLLLVFAAGCKEDVQTREARPGPWNGMMLAMASSEDGGHFAYPTFEGGKWLVVVGGVEGPEYDGILPCNRGVPQTRGGV